MFRYILKYSNYESHIKLHTLKKQFSKIKKSTETNHRITKNRNSTLIHVHEKVWGVEIFCSECLAGARGRAQCYVFVPQYAAVREIFLETIH